MTSDSHATITYTLMSSYEVTINGYYGMPMDPLDPYVQLVMGAPPSPDYIPGPKTPPSPDYIPGPEAPPSPNYIPGPEAPPLPDYIPGPEYPEYLPPADDMLPAEEQPLPATVSPTAESPGYITESEPKMEPEENDGDDEKSEGDSINYPTSEGDNDANDDGDDLSEDDANDEDEDESSNKPFEEGETAATPPPFGYSPVSLTSYTLPPLLTPLPIYTPLPTSSFPLPSSIPSTSGSESIPEANIPLQKRARFTTLTSRYEIGESSVAATARQIRPTLTIAESRRADGKLIGRLRRERRYFYTVAITYAQEVAHSRDYCARIMDYYQSREVHTSTLVTQMEALRREKMAPKRRTTRLNPGVNAALAARDATRNGEDSHTSGTGARRPVQAARECAYSEFIKCKPLDFKSTEGVVELTRWFEKMESVFSISNCTASNQ
nr:hypothetical protein [Tanacetum cinerariifolium]